MSLNVEEMAAAMLAAFQGSLSEKWPEVKEYAEAEAKKLAENFVLIEKLYLTNKINERQAELHRDIQKNATRAVLLAIEGLGLLAVEEAINSALDVLIDTVNTALGFDLL
ncbi:MAG: hypothetical protein HWD84_07505 [Flavobacteriaceae bacterium]|nr:hypothetical protein [Flavobacteriaceae bacterium]